MAAFWTGFFTLLAALGAVWLKDHLERKKEYKYTLKQKAIEAYTLANRLVHAHNAKEIICSNLIQDANYKYQDMLTNFPDTMFVDLEKLELLIVENFLDLNDDFLQLNKVLLAEASKLFGIISNPKSNDIKLEEFEESKKNYQNQVLIASRDLRKKLIDRYINVVQPPINFYDSIFSIKSIINNFFKKQPQR